MMETTRTTVVLPTELLKAVDRIAGARRRSQFVTEAVKEKVARRLRSEALARAAGSINLADYPHWSSSEKISDWFHELAVEDERLSRKREARTHDTLLA